ncbi:MAG TPA: GNAT family N-acetyltransferase [Candidatus Dojkabacteria bacterium]|nr:GNAT family N-acetyltransferase [Candidatus Dojkabacteria bacterium]
MEEIFKEVSLNEIQDLITEASTSNDFSASIDSNESLKDTMKNFIGNKDFHVFLLTSSDNQEIGFTSTFPNKHEGRISIGYAFVKKEYRGKGYGYTMRLKLIDWIKRQGFKEIYAKTWKKNLPMIRLNEKMGFKFVEEVANDRKDGDSTIKYLLEI